MSGDAVNLCARIAGAGQPGEVRLTRSAFLEISKDKRLRCRSLPAATLKGIPEPVDMVLLEWRDRTRFAARILVAESGEEIHLPQQDIITFGRLRDQNGIPANDVVLALPDPDLSQQVSRWHFELRRHPTGFMLRSVTDQTTEVDGKPLAKGEEVAVGPGSSVKVARVMTLELLGDAGAAQSRTGDVTAYKLR